MRAPTHTESTAIRVESLDSLRGVAILAVIGFHVSKLFEPAPWIKGLAVFGNQGVQLFFLVSAITMTLMWQQRRGESRPQLRFYVRRFCRIAPLFWFAIAFYTTWDAFKLGVSPARVFTPLELWLTATFLHGFSPDAINLVVPGGWSIAVEMSFYAVFPLLIAAGARADRALWGGFAAYLVLGVAATTFVEHRYAPPPIFLYYCMLTQFPVFLVGIYVCDRSLLRLPVRRTTALAVAALWIGAALLGKFVLKIDSRPFLWIEVAALAVFCAWSIERGWSWRPLRVIGGLSYSMYLFHFVVLDLAERSLPGSWRHGTAWFVLAFVVVTAATSLVAKASALTFEAWSAALGRRILRLIPAA